MGGALSLLHLCSFVFLLTDDVLLLIYYDYYDLRGTYSVVCCVKFSADGKYLATGSNRSTQIYDTQSGQKVCTLVDEDAVTGKQGDLYIRSVCFSPCGRWLATGAEDKVVRVSALCVRNHGRKCVY
jgi:WD40 repeat protein